MHYLFSSFFLVFTFNVAFSHADGMDSRNPSVATRGAAAQGVGTKRVPAEHINKRLPPVIPGQRVTAGGSQHKVISTSGPVPVAPAPRAPQAARAATHNSGVNALGGVSVIVDRHKDDKSNDEN